MKFFRAFLFPRWNRRRTTRGLLALAGAFSVFLLTAEAAPSPTPTPENLASPGFFQHASAHGGFLGFVSGLYLREPGIWGVLCLTAEQGEALSSAFAETWLVRIENPGMEPKKALALEVTFRQRRDEIYSDDQRETLRTVNEAFRAFAEDRPNPNSDEMQAFLDSIRPQLTAAQWENLLSVRGQKP